MADSDKAGDTGHTRADGPTYEERLAQRQRLIAEIALEDANATLASRLIIVGAGSYEDPDDKEKAIRLIVAALAEYPWLAALIRADIVAWVNKYPNDALKPILESLQEVGHVKWEALNLNAETAPRNLEAITGAYASIEAARHLLGHEERSGQSSQPVYPPSRSGYPGHEPGDGSDSMLTSIVASYFREPALTWAGAIKRLALLSLAFTLLTVVIIGEVISHH